MSAPTPAPGDDRPRDGYYPDPSIPGYVRYWNGAAWVPGTSRPAPTDGEPLAPPPGAGPVAAPAPAPVEETGPHFFDEDPADGRHGSRPEPATAWGADRSRQSGFGGEQDRRVSWGSPEGADPRTQGAPPAQPDGHAARTDGTATIPPAEPDAGGTRIFRRATAGSGGAAPARPADGSRTGGPVDDPGTMTFRALSQRTGGQSGAAGAQSGSTGQPAPGAGAQPAPGTPGFGAGKAAAERAAGAQAGAVAPGASAAPTALSGPQQTPPAAQAPAPNASVPQQAGPQPNNPGPQPAPAASATPMTAGPGGGQPSWAQQVHRLAEAPGEGQPVAPWKPPVEDIFQAAARRQASARPAGLGKRLAARLVDSLVLGAVTAVAAVPLGTKAIDHVNEKVDAAKLSGETVTVWLLDGTTSVYLGIVLAVLLVTGVLYEVLPTVKWGRTLGKKLLGLEVRDIEGHEPPSFGAALRRWLVYCVPGLLAIGIVGVLWGLFDRPWRQCWHDKAAHTFVAG